MASYRSRSAAAWVLNFLCLMPATGILKSVTAATEMTCSDAS